MPPPFGESPEGTSTQIISTPNTVVTTALSEATTTEVASFASIDPLRDMTASLTKTWQTVTSPPFSTLSSSATYPRLAEVDTTWTWGEIDGAANHNNTLLGSSEESESHLVLILSVVTACGVILVLLMMLAIVIACRLRRLSGTEPQLLTFSLSGDTASPSNSQDVQGIVNQAYASEFTHFDSFTSSLDRKYDDGDVLDNSDTESAHAVEGCQDNPPPRPREKIHKGKAPKAPKKASIKKTTSYDRSKHIPEKQGFNRELTVPSFHTENGISECVNPLYGKENAKPYVKFPLESISEDEVENSELGEGTPNEMNRHGSMILDDVSSTFPDVDHKCLDNVPGINMADSVSNTQSCPNTPLMHARPEMTCLVTTLAHGTGDKTVWVSESNIKTKDDDDRSFRGSDCVNKSSSPVGEFHGSWRGDLDETLEAKTSF